MEDDVIKLLFWLMQELKKKNYLNDDGMINQDIMGNDLQFSFPRFMAKADWSLIDKLPETERELYYDININGYYVCLQCNPNDINDWDWYDYRAYVDGWQSVSRNIISDEKMIELIKLTANTLKITLYKDELEKAADLLSDDEFDDI